ncbi:hypothetical protein ACCI51_01715 [Microbulbifer echini]|uniref:Integrase catalytic domain-containing protein n=1 Tax=Microbulbifer echini TaxID=1529067 RepID=A0ABV4NJK1_9GAMM
MKTGEVLDSAIYFAHPYTSWGSGLNEITNGLLRQYFPRNTDFKLVIQNDVEVFIERLHNRLRKRWAIKFQADIGRIYGFLGSLKGNALQS